MSKAPAGLASACEAMASWTMWTPDQWQVLADAANTGQQYDPTELDRLRAMRVELTAFCDAVEADGEHRTFLLAGVRNIIRKANT